MADKQTKPTKKTPDKPKDSEKQQYYYAVGRRKEATARMRFYPVANNQSITIDELTIKRGQMYVNGRPIEQYFPGEVFQRQYMEPFRTTNTLDRFAVSARIVGGGPAGQLGAFIHAAARTLEKIDADTYRPILKKRGFLTRDPREKERRKAGLAQSARAEKQSPKR